MGEIECHLEKNQICEEKRRLIAGKPLTPERWGGRGQKSEKQLPSPDEMSKAGPKIGKIIPK